MTETNPLTALKKRVLERVGYFDAVRDVHPTKPTLSPQQQTSAESQSSDELDALRVRYEAFDVDARLHSQWCSSLVQEIDFKLFRGDSALMYQHRDANMPVTYLATYYYHALSGDRDLLETCTEDTSFGVYAFRVGSEIVTRDRLDSVSEIGFLREVLELKPSSSLSILDIGSGYGRLAWRINQCFPNVKVVCADAIPESAFLCGTYLSFRGASPSVKVVALPDLSTELSQTPVDVAIAVNSLSECSAQAIVWWLDLLLAHRVKYIILIPHGSFDEGKMLLSCESGWLTGTPGKALLPLLEERGYRPLLTRPKYREPQMQRYGVSPTYYHLFKLSNI